jgi:hypothetical protein
MRPAISLIGSSNGNRRFNCFVGDSGCARFQKSFGQSFVGGQMQIGEKNLSGSQQFDFGRLRFLHFHDHFGLLENLGVFGKNRCARIFVIFIRIPGARARIFFYDDFVPALDELVGSRWKQRDAMFLFLNFFGNADNHKFG